MHEKIVEILIYLLSELRKNTPIQDIDLTVLSKNGYSPAEISTAFNWLYEKINDGENLVIDQTKSSPHSHRVLHDAERYVITPEAYGFLIQLREIGLITDNDIEVIIERVMMSGFVTVTLDEMKAQVSFLLLENDDSSEHGSRKMLHGRDTIH
ncbi:MAG: DUF494 family protein [Bacteroidetes bacterium]|nr:DUF494 family protein [Bacteroidota bacterium]